MRWATPNPTNAGTVPNGGKGRIVWESLPFFFWVGGIDERSFCPAPRS
jgi:hypothetical protein